MKLDVLLSFAEEVLPLGILNFFDISLVERIDNNLRVHLIEKNIIPDHLSHLKLESKGFHEAKTIQDFPVRGRAMYLVVKRRRWQDLESGQTYSSDWELIAKGTSYSKEFGEFLKKIN